MREYLELVQLGLSVAAELLTRSVFIAVSEALKHLITFAAAILFLVACIDKFGKVWGKTGEGMAKEKWSYICRCTTF